MASKNKIRISVFFLISLALLGVFFYAKQEIDQIRREGRTTHWPEAHVIRFFNTVTIDASFSDSLKPGEVKISEKEFSDLVLDACRETLKKSGEFDDVAIEHLGDNISFDNHPLNMGLRFYLVKNAPPFVAPQNYEIKYRFVRRSFAFEPEFYEGELVLIREGDIRAGRPQPGGTADVFVLPDDISEQRMALRFYAERRCDELRDLMSPNADNAAEYEAEILKNANPIK